MAISIRKGIEISSILGFVVGAEWISRDAPRPRHYRSARAGVIARALRLHSAPMGLRRYRQDDRSNRDRSSGVTDCRDSSDEEGLG